MITNLKALVRRTSENPFLVQNAVFFVGSLIVAGLNYLYHPILSRIMPVSSFGEVQSLLSLYTQTSIILGAFSLIIITAVSNYDTTERNTFLYGFQQFALYCMAAIALLFIVFAPSIKSFFNLSSVVPFIPLLATLFLQTAITFRSAYLQGMKKFAVVSWQGGIYSVAKLLVTIVLVLVTGAFLSTVMSAILGFMIAHVVTLLYLMRKTRAAFSYDTLHRCFVMTRRERVRAAWNIGVKQIPFALFIISTLGFVTFLQNGDVLIMKHYFQSDIVGGYSGIATIGRIIFFVTASISGVLLPNIQTKNSPSENALVLKKSFIIITAIGGAVTLFFVLFPKFVIGLLLGARYLPWAYMLPLLSLTLFVISCINLLFYFFVALRYYWLILVSVLGLGILMCCIILSHATAFSVIQDFLYGSVTTLLLLGVLFWTWYSKRTKTHSSVLHNTKEDVSVIPLVQL